MIKDYLKTIDKADEAYKTGDKSVKDSIKGVIDGGSRTKVHKHDGSQALIVTEDGNNLEIYQADTEEGVDGSFKITKTDEMPLGIGDVVHMPHDTLHTHGSISPGETLSHAAINNRPCGAGDYIATWYVTNKNTITGRI